MGKKRQRFSDQIRQAIDASGRSRYQICKDLELSESTMSRFMADKGGLSMEVVDKLAALLGFTLHVRSDSVKGK
jgi:ribosome-binding protein aMBF1 (putative translation factor)